MRAPWIAAAIALWALHFTAIYGFAGIACARGLERAVPGFIAVATLLAAGAAVFLIARGVARRESFAGWMTAALAAVALYAIVLEALPALWIAPCVAR